MNSVSESLWYGVPMVVIPQMSEQAMVGRRVEQLGAGVYLSKSEVTAETLRKAVLRVVGSPGYRECAETVRSSFADAGGVSRAADAIFTYTGR
jgi:UDP:flavonoid glycosyltransferase YjiC (YdhE family)